MTFSQMSLPLFYLCLKIVLKKCCPPGRKWLSRMLCVVSCYTEFNFNVTLRGPPLITQSTLSYHPILVLCREVIIMWYCSCLSARQWGQCRYYECRAWVRLPGLESWSYNLIAAHRLYASVSPSENRDDNFTHITGFGGGLHCLIRVKC